MDGASHIFSYIEKWKKKLMRTRRKIDFGGNVGSCRLEHIFGKKTAIECLEPYPG